MMRDWALVRYRIAISENLRPSLCSRVTHSATKSPSARWSLAR